MNNDENPLTALDLSADLEPDDHRSARRRALVCGALVIVAALLAAAWFVVPVVTRSGSSAQAQQTGTPGAAGHEVRNGEIPAADLVEIGDGFFLVAPAARAFRDMTAALARDGHTFTVNSAYRSRADQERMVEKYGLLEDGGRAAPVGDSEHGLGTAVDMTMDYGTVDWLRKHASDYGFAETITEEPWHWDYVGDLVQD